jgi:hypothetical protein
MHNQDDSRNERFGRERNPVENRGTRTFPTKSRGYEVGTRASAASSRAGPTRHLCRRSQAAAVGDGLIAEIDTDDGVVIVAMSAQGLALSSGETFSSPPVGTSALSLEIGAPCSIDRGADCYGARCLTALRVPALASVRPARPSRVACPRVGIPRLYRMR